MEMTAAVVGPAHGLHGEVTLDVRTGRPNTEANFIACADIQVTYPGVNLTTPTACATTHYN